ncbi:uncharacterized protein LOC128230613 isoform X2 [Mya arenaria]|uniref:uncharacterized protein LOC128230613 isoform X2 n=1 Tax=Mya arenaria TaxID=6604 RepID=UPI0022E37887|nr:uncharacterized protein LOC128230613 isoform X2 [Mya arenaria]
MDNGDAFLDDIDATDLFGTQNDGNGSVFNWADEFLNDDHEMGASSVATELGNLSRNVNPSTLLTSAPVYGAGTSLPSQNVSTSVVMGHGNLGLTAVLGQSGVVTSQQQAQGLSSQILQPGALIVKTASGQQIQVNRQTQLQLQAQLLQQQQQQQQQMSTGFNQPTMLGRSVTPNSASGSMGLTFAANNVSQTISQLKSASPAPNMNILQLPAQVHNQQQQQPQQHQQFQIAPGTILQIPSSQTLGGASQSISGLVQGGALIGTPQQQTNLVNNQNSVIQNPNIVNVNFNQPQMLLNSQTQQRSNLNITNIQTPTHSPFNIQGTLIRTAEGKSILIPSQNLAHPINIQGLSLGTPLGQTAIQQPQQTANMLVQQQQQQQVDNRTNQGGLQQFVVNHQGQQLVLQRANTGVSVSQPQNIVVRTAAGQSSIVQIQPNTQQIQSNVGQSLHLVNPTGGQTAGVPMVNIGGQNIPLSQITSQLSNLQQQQQQQQQLTIQPSTSIYGQLTLNSTQTSLQGHSQQVLLPNPGIATQSTNSVENQTKLILQQIHESLKKSQAQTNQAVSNSLQAFSLAHSQAPPNMSVTNIKQEPGIQGNRVLTHTFVPATSVKTESNMIESLIKQEADVKPTCLNTASGQQGTNFHHLLTNNVQNTQVTTTVSNSTTQMSLFIMSNSSNVMNNSMTSISSALNANSSMTQTYSASAGGNVSSLGQTTQVVQGRQLVGGTTTQTTIQLPSELQEQFQRVQFEMQKVQASATMTPEQKQQRLQQFQMLQKKILLKGRVLSTKSEPSQLQQTLTGTTLSSSTSGAPIVCSSLQSSQLIGQQSSSQNYQDIVQNSQISNQGIQLGQQASLSQMVANLTKPSSSKGHVATILPLQQSALPVSLAPQAMSTAVVTVTSAAEGTGQTALQTSTTATSGGTQVAVPTQIKIADKMLTLSLTPAQREKVQSYLDMMTPEQQQQYLQTQQHVLQRIQRQQELNAQIRAQVEAQKKLAAANSQSPIPSTVNVGSSGSRLGTSFSQVETMTSAPQIPTPVATSMIPDLKTIPIPSTLVSVKSSPSASGAILNRGTKRSYLDIPKGTLINQQIRQDQNHAVAPDVKRPFHSWDDACRRLLRYHVFQSYGPSPKEFERFDEAMEDISVDLLTKKDTMMEKFRMLLLQETIRTKPSSELVMLQRMQNQELRKLLEEEKKQSIIDPDSFTPMPMRYLVKTERSESHTDAEASHSGSPPSFTVKQGPVNEESLNMDSSHDNSSFEEQGEGDIKVRKLVIKSDGMNFSSAFKRQSLDQSEISFDHIGDNSEMDDSCFSPAKRRRTTIDSNSAYESASALEEEDENTNDYSGLEDETRQAAIMISSADESEDTQQEYSENPFSVSRQSSIGNSHLNGRNFELSGDAFDFNESSKIESVHNNSKFSSYGPNYGSEYQPANSPLSDDATGDDDDDDNDDTLGNSEDTMDMYQPITESLTDSEENSYYPGESRPSKHASNLANKEGKFSSQLSYTGYSQSLNQQDSDQDSDQDVKAQMESAINSILSLSHTVTDDSAVYQFNQSNAFLHDNDQSDTLFVDPNDFSENLNSQMNGNAQMGETEFSLDLDDAVNSILT